MATPKETWDGLVRCEKRRDPVALERHRRHAKEALDHELDLAMRLGIDFAYRLIWDMDGMVGWDRDKP